MIKFDIKKFSKDWRDPESMGVYCKTITEADFIIDKMNKLYPKIKFKDKGWGISMMRAGKEPEPLSIDLFGMFYASKHAGEERFISFYYNKDDGDYSYTLTYESELQKHDYWFKDVNIFQDCKV